MRKIITIMLALALCLSMTVPAMAYSDFAVPGQPVTISSDGYHAAVIRPDGSLWVWGGMMGSSPITKPEKLLDDCVSVSVGHMTCAAIKKDGSLWVWGDNSFGAFGNGTTTSSLKTPIKVMDGVKAVSCGWELMLILKTDGTLWSCGLNYYDYDKGGNVSALGNAGAYNLEIQEPDHCFIQTVPVKILDNVAAISGGVEMGAAIKTDGTLWTWGGNIGTCIPEDSSAITPVKVAEGVTAVSCASAYTGYLKADGSYWICDGYATSFSKQADDVVFMNAKYAYIKKDGSLWMWGKREDLPFSGDTPQKVMDNTAAVYYHDSKTYPFAIVAKKDGTVWVIGDGHSGQLGNGTSGKDVFSDKWIQVTFGDEKPAADPDAAKKVENIFKDVPANAWYKNFLQKAYDNNIVGGTSKDAYTPNGNLNHGQIMVMAANLHSKQKGDKYDFQANKKAGSPWYQAYEDYCKAEGIIDNRFDGKETQNVSREEMAYYFANTLTDASYKNKMQASFVDVAGSEYKAEIQKLANADIVGGMGEGKYAPDALVTRAQASVFISNILDAMQ